MVLPIGKMDLPTSINISKIASYRQAQRAVSLLIQDFVKFTININQHHQTHIQVYIKPDRFRNKT